VDVLANYTYSARYNRTARTLFAWLANLHGITTAQPCSSRSMDDAVESLKSRERIS
jgi:hypothetical protein